MLEGMAHALTNHRYTNEPCQKDLHIHLPRTMACHPSKVIGEHAFRYRYRQTKALA